MLDIGVICVLFILFIVLFTTLLYIKEKSLTFFIKLYIYIILLYNINIMSKNIYITGKNNIDKISHMENNNKEKIKAVRCGMEDIFEEDISHKKQLQMINLLFFGDIFEYKSTIEKEIERKCQGYKQQDIKKGIYNPDFIIKNEKIIEKLVISKLKCFYCSNEIFVLYTNVRDPSQWTLDRKDNDECHSNENTLISCLRCNLQRRVTDLGKFIFTKHLRIKKGE